MSLYVSSGSSSASVSSGTPANNTPINQKNANSVCVNSSNKQAFSYPTNDTHSSVSSSSSKSSNNLNFQLNKMQLSPTYYDKENQVSSSPSNIFSLDNFLNEANLFNSVYLYSDINNNRNHETINNQNDISNLSTMLKNKLENLIKTHIKLTDKGIHFDESFVSELFNSIYTFNYKINNFRSIYNEIDQSNLTKNIFLVIARVGHECFRLNLYTTCEYLLDFVLSNIETQSSKLKMAALSTLSACYWRLGKFNESINLMNLELTLVSRINNNDLVILNNNKYRIYGNLASAYQQLNNQVECFNYYNMQLKIAIEMGNNQLAINTLNSLGLFCNSIQDYNKAIKYFDDGLNYIEKNQSDFAYDTMLKLKLKQLSLIAEFYLKTNNYDKSKSLYLQLIDINLKLINQLIISSFNSGSLTNLSNEKLNPTNENDDIINYFLQECVALLNLGLICSKLKNQKESVEFYEKCLNNLQMNLSNSNSNLKMKSYKANYQKIIELYGRVYIGLINNYIMLNDDLRASLYAHSMLDYTLKEYVKLKDDEKISELDYYVESNHEPSSDLVFEYQNRYKYLKFLELTACSKLAICYAKQDRLNDALKLHQREAILAAEFNNVLYVARAYSNMAQIYFIEKNYEKSIHLYKQILETIETSLLNINNSSIENKTNHENSLALIKYELCNTDKFKDERITQMIYFTLSNIGLCMEMLNRFEDARSMFQEQYEISILLNNPKFKSNALNNLFNLYSNKLRSNEQQKQQLTKKQLQNDQIEFVKILNSLFQVYKELNDISGQLFTSQSLSYYYHSSGFFKKAIKCYLFNIKYCKLLNENDNLKKSLFNISLCYKSIKNYQDSYKYQFEYFNLINKPEENDYNKFVSLGIIADLLFDMDKSNDSCQNCIQIHVDRLKIVKNAKINDNDVHNMIDEEEQLGYNSNQLNQNEKKITNKNKCKLIGDCLESIAKCYYQMENYQQVLKFKLLQIELKNEIESLYHDPSDLQSHDFNLINKQKCKIWLDIGNLFLFKFESTSESKKYFELVQNMSKEMNDLLLESLTLGNIGLCYQKDANYEKALDYFQQQLIVLKSKLGTINENDLLNKQDESDNSSRASSSMAPRNLNSSPELSDKQLLKFTNKNIFLIKEIVSIRIDIGRSNARLAKCCQLMSDKNQIFQTESLNYYNKYAKECLYLFENYAKPYFIQLDRKKKLSKLHKKPNNTENFNSESQNSFSEINNTNFEEEESLTEDVKQISNDLIEQIYIDYDTSLTKLAQYYLENIDKSIELNQLRLSLLNYCSKFILEKDFKVNSSILINFTLANLNSRVENRLVKAVSYCENIIKIYDKESNNTNKIIKDDIYLIETLNLLSDVSAIKLKDNKEYEYILENVMKTYKLIWQHNDYYDFKILELKYYTTCRLSAVYKKLHMTKECLEILMEAKNKFSAEFQQLQQIHHSENESNNSSTSNLDDILLHYIEYLFLLHRKIALIHMKHLKTISKEDNIQDKSYMLILKHVNEASTYLKYQKDFQCEQTFKIREASIFYLLGLCYKILKNNEMELEMFANSLDLYENLFATLKPTTDKNELNLRENSNFSSSSVNYLFDSFKNDYDEETQIDCLKRVDELYELIQNSLIKMGKHKEAILVIERHKVKTCSYLSELQDLVDYNQISELLNEKINLNAVLFYNINRSSCTLNCWLLQPGSTNNDIIKFHQTNYNNLDSLVLGNQINDENAQDNINESLLIELYNILIKPFESHLFSKTSIQMQCNLTKPLVFIVYDELTFNIPFHLLKKSIELNISTPSVSKYFYEIFEIDCVYSIKYLAKRSYNNKYIKNKQISPDSSLLFPMKVVSNFNEVEKIITSFNSKNCNAYQYDLILILTDAQNKCVKELNSIINKLMSKKITKSVLIELKEKENLTKNLLKTEQNSKAMLKMLYSKMINRTTLNSTLIFNTLYDISKNKCKSKYFLNFLLFGNLSSSFLQNVVDKQKISSSVSAQEQTNAFTSESLFFGFDSHSSTNNNTSSNRLDKQINVEIEDETNLKDIFIDLGENDYTELKFSQAVLNFLKLNYEFDSKTLNIVVNILSEYLDEKEKHIRENSIHSESEKLENLYDRFKKYDFNINQLKIMRTMLQTLGFKFYIDSNEKYMVKMSDKVMNDKLKLILKCLKIFQNFSTKFLKLLFELTLTTNGNEFLCLIRDQILNETQSTSVLSLNSNLFKINEKFLKELMKKAHFDKANGLFKIEIDTFLLSNLILVLKIIQHKTTRKENNDSKAEEQYFKNMIEAYFKNLDNLNNQIYDMVYDEDDDDDLSSQYSTLSSILGIRTQDGTNKNQSIISKKNKELEKKPSKVDEIAKAKQFVNKLHKKIDININKKINESPSIYNAYLTELENDLSSSSNVDSSKRQSRIDLQVIKNENSLENRNKKVSDETIENEFRSKSLVRLEDKEYSNHIVTTTTTVHTMTTQDIFMQFEESNYYDNENQYANLSNLNTKILPIESHVNSNIYSCLTNYVSNNKNTNNNSNRF